MFDPKYDTFSIKETTSSHFFSYKFGPPPTIAAPPANFSTKTLNHFFLYPYRPSMDNNWWRMFRRCRTILKKVFRLWWKWILNSFKNSRIKIDGIIFNFSLSVFRSCVPVTKYSAVTTNLVRQRKSMGSMFYPRRNQKKNEMIFSRKNFGALIELAIFYFYFPLPLSQL